MSAQGPREELPFSEDEMFRAMRMILPEDEAREMAERWASIPDEIERGAAIGWGLENGTYLFLSLLGGETARRVEAEYIAHLSAEERSEFELQREALRQQLEDEGKLRS